MTKLCYPRVITRAVLGLLLLATCATCGVQAGQVEAVETGPMRVFRDASGESYFSLSLSAPQQPAGEAAAAKNIVVLFDTSASQSGMYRETTLAALDSYLSKLAPTARVRLVAADLEARPLNGSFEPAEMVADGAAEKLRGETPLGSTDLAKALKSAAAMLAGATGTTQVLYIGDGVSAANLLDGPEFASVVRELRNAQITVSSYAVGPERDAQLLAALANQTGGNLYVDQSMAWADDTAGVTLDRALQENRRRGTEVGRTLADWAAGNVYWPEQVSLGGGVDVVYPVDVPPLRSDRDTVLLGRLTPNANTVNLAIKVANGSANQTLAVSRPTPQPAEALSLIHI